jgi:hypothetical protein
VRGYAPASNPIQPVPAGGSMVEPHPIVGQSNGKIFRLNIFPPGRLSRGVTTSRHWSERFYSPNRIGGLVGRFALLGVPHRITIAMGFTGTSHWPPIRRSSAVQPPCASWLPTALISPSPEHTCPLLLTYQTPLQTACIGDKRIPLNQDDIV